LAHLLTETQIAAALLVGRIYAAYERWHGQNRNPAAPGYVRIVQSGQPDDAEPVDALEPETPDERDARQRRADERYMHLQDLIDNLPGLDAIQGRVARTMIEALCVDDLHVHTSNLPGLKYALDAIAVRFNLTGAKRATYDMRITARRPVRRQRDNYVKRPDPTKQAFFEFTAARRTRDNLPPLLPDELEAEWLYLQALKSRGRFRREKARR
jgi:hypothetical protein